MPTGTGRTVAALKDIGDGLESVGENFANLVGETKRQRRAVQDLGTKIDKLQSTADDIKEAVADDKQCKAQPDKL